jgi:serine/threonine protein kinase
MDNPTNSTPLLGNRYQLQQTLGTGGMAVVYKAWDMHLERIVAIKLLRADYSRSEAFRDRFKQEAKAAANLSHPNIVTVHDFGLDAGRLFMVMEYVPGTDLKSMLKLRGRFSTTEAVNLIVQACSGIGYAHRAGLVHCDVKPHNFIVTPDQRLKVTDFGIARALASINPDERYDVIWGSPQYFAPEQASGGSPSPATDVYSLGVILYEMLTGRLPFIAETAAELARMHREVAPIPPRRFAPNIPPALEQILLKVLSKEPAARYRTADQLGRILITFTSQTDPYINNLPPLAAQPSTNTMPTQASRVEAETIPPTSPYKPMPMPVQPTQSAEASPISIDWGITFLGLFAVLAVGGLIPFWLYIWFALTQAR